MLNRREFLKNSLKAAGGMALAGNLLAQPYRSAAQDDLEKFDFLFTRIRFESDQRVSAPWNTYPTAERYLLEEFSKVVRCKTKPVPNTNGPYPLVGMDEQFNAVVNLDSVETLRPYPFLFMTSEGYYTFNDRQKRALKGYLEQGGFLLMDDCCWQGAADYFYQSSFKLLQELFGPNGVRLIPSEHEVFHNVFDLGAVGLPWLQGQNRGAQGVILDNRLAVFLSSTDLHCGWVDRDNTWFGPRGNRPVGRHSYQHAIQMGINLIMYSLSH